MDFIYLFLSESCWKLKQTWINFGHKTWIVGMSDLNLGNERNKINDMVFGDGHKMGREEVDLGISTKGHKIRQDF